MEVNFLHPINEIAEDVSLFRARHQGAGIRNIERTFEFAALQTQESNPKTRYPSLVIS